MVASMPNRTPTITLIASVLSVLPMVQPKRPMSISPTMIRIIPAGDSTGLFVNVDSPCSAQIFALDATRELDLIFLRF